MAIGRGEIGSEFWDIPQSKKTVFQPFPAGVNWYLSGASALHAIINDLKKDDRIHTVAMPSWCCESMIKPFFRHDVQVMFYPVFLDDTGAVHCEFSEIDRCDVLFVMDYFGYRRACRLPQFSGKIIRDLTHSVFCGSYSDADYYFGSLRKWCGFWTGGFAWKRNGAGLDRVAESPEAETYIRLRKYAMADKKAYLERNYQSKGYLKTFNQAEELLERDCTGMAAERDVIAVAGLDIEKIRERRRKNAAVLLDAFSDLALFPELGDQDCPLFVPICLPGNRRKRVREKLIEQEIFCPIHWPVSDLHRLDDRTDPLYQTELSLVCDQRYAQEDMMRERDALLALLR